MRVTEATRHYEDTSTSETPPPRGMARTWCDRVVPLAEVTSVRRRVNCVACRLAARINIES